MLWPPQLVPGYLSYRGAKSHTAIIFLVFMKRLHYLKNLLEKEAFRTEICNQTKYPRQLSMNNLVTRHSKDIQFLQIVA